MPVRASRLLILFFSITCIAQVPSREKQAQQQVNAQPAPAPQQPEAAHELTAADLDAFFNGMIPAQIETNNVAGAVVAVVKDGQVLFEKGFGYADIKEQRPVSPDSTLFRPGSISKLFTWTAVMQLVEQGKLDLDRDVNDYIDFKIPPKFGKPITLRNLMTHTPGFEETIKDLITGNERPLPLDQYMKSHIPARIFPPGEFGAYSNYGCGLAGYIVQRVSGEKFEDYINRHIFEPLRMQHSSFEQPLPANLKDLMSKGYKTATEQPKAFEVVNPPPAGALAASADDLARFMIAHLNHGSYNGAQILKPTTADLMHSAQWSPGPGLNSICLGFYEDNRNGHRVIGHGGDTDWFHSDMHLVLDANVGLFISYNSAGRSEGGGRAMIYRQFMDRYLPQAAPEKRPAIASATPDGRGVTGEYITTRRSQDNIFWITTMLGESRVTQNSDGTISVDDFKGPNKVARKWEEIAPGQWRANAGDRQSQIDFFDKDGGKVLAIDFPAIEYQRARWYQSQRLNTALAICSVAIAALTLLLWPIAAVLRVHYGTRLLLNPKAARRRRLVYLTCAAIVAFFVIAAVIVSKIDNAEQLNATLDPAMRLMQALAWLCTIGTLVVLLNLFSPWSRERPWWATRLCDFLIAVACVCFVWIVAYWKVLTGSLHY